MTDRPIRIVLDASAIVAYARGSIDVGETIGEVNDDGATVGLPVLSLIEANRVVVAKDWPDNLLDHEATAVLDVDGSDWRALAAMYDTIDPLDAASAALATIDYRCPVLTSRPAQYGATRAADWVITLPPE